MIKRIIFFFILSVSCSHSQSKTKLDSTYLLREFALNEELNLNERISYARKAVELSNDLKRDSTILKSNKLLSFLYFQNQKVDSVKALNYQNLKLARRLKDSASIANINFILGFVFHEKEKLDSAYYYYYNANKVFKTIGDRENQGEVLLNMADLQKSEKDYIGSEINAINAIKLISKLPETEDNLDTLWSLYNLLGVVTVELQEYKRALKYHNKALSIVNKMKDGYFYRIYSESNIASIYRRQGNYSKAKKVFNLLLKEEKLIKNDSASYASITSSLAYCKFINKEKTKNIETLFRKALNIYLKINNKEGQAYTSNCLAEYFKANNKPDSALKYTNRAYKIAKEANLNQDILKSLMLKSALVKDSAHLYFKEHAKLSDSLQKAERAIRNKFARIEYETEEVKLENLEVKQENQQITRQRLWLLLVTGILAITLFLLYIIKTQREKNKELELAQKQQEFNEEIYNLMLSQQEKIDQGRAQEKKQISQELHDGVLGRLFGVRLSLDSLNFSKTDEAIETRSNYIEELQAIEQDIRKVSHELNTDFVSNSGYFDIVKALVEKQTDAYNLEYSIEENNDINWDALTNKVKMHCYRIIQESLQNIYKHAKGSRVDISFEQIGDQLKLIIKDDGAGFDLNKAKKGIGLKNMYARVKEIQGELNINTKLNEGTKLTIQVPN